MRKNTKPLAHIGVLVTRAAERSDDLVAKLRKAGARVITFPTIRIADPPSWGPLDREIARIERYDYLIFASVNAVERFFARFAKGGGRPSSLKKIAICAVGRKTAGHLERHRLKAGIVPREFSSEGLLKLLLRKGVEGKRFLFPRTNKGSDVLEKGLRNGGGHVRTVLAYTTRRAGISPALLRLKLEEGVDIIAFASSQTAQNFFALARSRRVAEMIEKAKIVCIGRQTAERVKELGYRVSAVPRRPTIDGLVETIVKVGGDRSCD